MTGPEKVTLVASPLAHPSSRIREVEFFANGRYMGKSREAPFERYVPGMPAGYTAHARVTDTSGRVTVSEPFETGTLR